MIVPSLSDKKKTTTIHDVARRLAMIASLFAAGIPVTADVRPVSLGDPATSVRVPSSPVPESADFATRVLRDPWDMLEFSDISQYLNESGQRDLVRSIQMSGGLFSAESTSARDPYFFPLFPGYETAMLIGKVGAHYPVSSATYHCLHAAMRVESGPADSWGPDQYQVLWYADDRLNSGGAAWGYSLGIALYPEAGASSPEHSWRVYSVDLAALTSGGTSWPDQTYWRGLRIDPSIQADTRFSVDWIRLTDCHPNTQSITWTPDGAVDAIWVRPTSSTRDIRLVTGVNGSSGTHELDVQGLAPGSYSVGVGTTTTCCSDWSSGQLTINQTAIAHFVRPSFTSGTDYATSAGNPWDFSNESDTTQILNAASWSYENGILDLVTDPGPLSAGIDVQVHLTTPQPVDGRDYRYLSFRMNTEGPWQNTPEGWMARWIWTIPSLNGLPGYECHLVSQDIPYDVGWQVYTVDMAHVFNGSAEETSPAGPPHCPDLPYTWLQSGTIIKTRIDPNENITDDSLHQQLDWIRLTQIDRVVQGMPFMARVSVNKQLSEGHSLSYFYSTDPQSDPSQSTAVPCSSSPSGITSTSHIYLPLVNNEYDLATGGIAFCWDTASVDPGEYHLCVAVDDGYNQATYCSDAPVLVQAPDSLRFEARP
jgi:hypothetical protein